MAIATSMGRAITAYRLLPPDPANPAASHPLFERLTRVTSPLIVGLNFVHLQDELMTPVIKKW
jgi:hypothetical protein